MEKENDSQQAIKYQHHCLITLSFPNQTLHPFFCVRTVTTYNTPNHIVPSIKHTPDHTCTPMKSVRPSFFFSRAPAIGAPMSDAMLDTLHDIPSRVPSRDRSGVMLANAADGTVTSAAEKKPAKSSKYVCVMCMNEKTRPTP